MLRRLIRQGIRAVREGRDPKGLVRQAGAPVRTYANSIVVPLAKGATEEEDRAAVIAYTRDAAERIVSGRMHEEVSEFRELPAEAAVAEIGWSQATERWWRGREDDKRVVKTTKSSGHQAVGRHIHRRPNARSLVPWGLAGGNHDAPEGG
jgi:hypothetical protein